MEITDSKKFNKFISSSKDGALKILSQRFTIPLDEAEKEDVFQESAIALYEKIEAGNLTTLKCKIKKDGIVSEIALPVLDNEATPTLFSYFVEICYRQMLKSIERRFNTKGDAKKKYEDIIESMAGETGMSNEKIKEMLAGYSGIVDNDTRIKKIEMDDEAISNEQVLEILNVCSEEDNSIYKEIMYQALDMLAKRCRELLGSYYAHKTSWAEIALKLGIEGGADSAKSAASRCKKTLEKKCHEIERKIIW